MVSPATVSPPLLAGLPSIKAVFKYKNQILKILAQKFRSQIFGLLCVVGLDSNSNETQIFFEKLGCELKNVLF
jgi:hypothetical protein